MLLVTKSLGVVVRVVIATYIDVRRSKNLITKVDLQHLGVPHEAITIVFIFFNAFSRKMMCRQRNSEPCNKTPSPAIEDALRVTRSFQHHRELRPERSCIYDAFLYTQNVSIKE